VLQFLGVVVLRVLVDREFEEIYLDWEDHFFGEFFPIQLRY
jgi:hypothetical protein